MNKNDIIKLQNILNTKANYQLALNYNGLVTLSHTFSKSDCITIHRWLDGYIVDDSYIGELLRLTIHYERLYNCRFNVDNLYLIIDRYVIHYEASRLRGHINHYSISGLYAISTDFMDKLRLLGKELTLDIAKELMNSHSIYVCRYV